MKIFGISVWTLFIIAVALVIGKKYGATLPVIKSL
jgi:ABC-type uncharacterized transport system YnjBCD permease subunit